MNQFKFQTPVSCTKKEKIINVLIGVIYCCFIVWPAFLSFPLGFYLFGVCFFISLIFLWKYKKAHKRKYSEIFFELAVDKMKIIDKEETVIEYSGIKKIIIKFDNLKGSDVGIRSYIPSRGDENVIGITLKNNVYRRYMIFLSNDENYWNFELFAASLKKLGINVNMQGFLPG